METTLATSRAVREAGPLARPKFVRALPPQPARHSKWLNLFVLGCVTFSAGVLAYNVLA